ncbi:unnamed protein product [Heligmosomoides polygyrus]|uniref:Protein FAR1-RELATED SEQUENCE n=1 Tax=Heligmosomoides polygyrus TaxID=6339 RepID=A0A183F318_HELPZ|nr:unnamed protein product [Heligmosomoides polygyrus]
MSSNESYSAAPKNEMVVDEEAKEPIEDDLQCERDGDGDAEEPMENPLIVHEKQIEMKLDQILDKLDSVERREVLCVERKAEKRAHKHEDQSEKKDAKKTKVKEVLDEIQGKIKQLETKQVNQTNAENLSTSGKETATYRGPKKLYIFCNDQHWASNCTSFKMLSARRERAQKLGKCERCLYDPNT